MKERIKCAAIRLRNGQVVEGYTHREIVVMIHESNGYCPVEGVFGFVTESGGFVGRKHAASVALAAGQVTEVADPNFGLSSSDL